MEYHKAMTDSGSEFEVILGDDGLIESVWGSWPEPGGEFVLTQGVPGHAHPSVVPAHVAESMASGEEVCFYDSDNCQTCFCDETGRMRCVRIC